MSVINHTFMVNEGHSKMFENNIKIQNLLKVPGPMYEEAPFCEV